MTSREFAELIGVSQATVSRALNGRSSVCEKTRIYIEKKAEEYGIELDSLTRKDEILRAIMEAVLKKA